MSNSSVPYEAEWVTELRQDAALGKQLIAILSHYCGERGDNEGAVETLNRILHERALFQAPTQQT